MTKHRTAAEQLTIVKLYRAGSSSTQLAKRFGMTDTGIRKVLQRAGVDRRDGSLCHRRYALNEAAFDEVTPASAYWGGFLLADGAVCDTDAGSAPRIELALQVRDRGHVAAFKRFLGAGHPVVDRESQGSCRIAVRSKRLAAALVRFGVTPRKSFTAEVPKELEHNVDFWRGVMDGDGHFNDPRNFPKIKMVGAQHVVRQFASFCAAVVKPERLHVAAERGIFYTQLSGRDALDVIELLYRDATVALRRKQKAAQVLLARYAKRVFRLLPPRRPR